MTNPRLIACWVLIKIIKNKSSFDAESIKTLYPNLSDKDRAFCVNLCFGTLRYYFRLSNLLNKLLTKQLKPKDLDLKILILTGLYQLYYTRVPEYAAINSTVTLTKNLKKIWAKNLVNAVLRGAQKNYPDIDSITQFTNDPAWLVKLIKKSWPNDYEYILENNDKPAPLYLRYNETQSDDKFLPNLKLLEDTTSVENIKGFKEGIVSVQDGAGQLAAPLLDLQPNLTVLDACAAPGSKTGHILELEPNLKKLYALEKSSSRIKLLKSNLERLNFNNKVTILNVQAEDIEHHLPNQTFDRILLDAPCSGLGVIRRHPEIKILRDLQQIEQAVNIQKNLLKILWEKLNPEGFLLYCTCSILPQENHLIIQEFLQNQQNVKLIPTNIPFLTKTEFGEYLLTGTKNFDGFFYAKLQKTKES